MNISTDLTNYSSHVNEIMLDLNAGTHLLSFKMYGPNPDTYGPHIFLASLQYLIPIKTTTTNILDNLLPSDVILNKFTTFLNTIPGNRIFIYTLTNFLTTFDRLQFYYYHQHNLTQYSEMLLGSVNKLELDRGSLL